MAETKKAKTNEGGVFDVAKPGKSTPSSSSKPIIVTNRPVLKDPMVVDEDTVEVASSTAVSSPSLPTGKVKIEPLSSEEAPDKPTDEEKTEPAETDDKAEPKPTDDDKPTEAEDDLSKPKNNESDEAAVKKEAERAAELQKLSESHKYYLPINQVERRRSKRAVILGIFFILILGLAWLDVSLDSGIITIPGIKAPTHFFK